MRKGVDTYHMKDVWEFYALKLLRQNPAWCGVYKDKIQNYYIYAKYTDSTGKKHIDEVLSYKVFMDSMKVLMDLAKSSVVDGELFSMGRLGYLAARRVQRDHSKKVVNYERTNQQPKVWNEEKQKFVPSKLIFYTTDDWCRVGWHKQPKWVPNLTVYEFKPAKDLRSGKGFNQIMVKALKSNPMLKYKYFYYPLQKRKKQTA
jgi:hypothetical protein